MTNKGKTRSGQAAAKRQQEDDRRPLRFLTEHEARNIYTRQIANSPEDKRRYHEWLEFGQWDTRIW